MEILEPDIPLLKLLIYFSEISPSYLLVSNNFPLLAADFSDLKTSWHLIPFIVFRPIIIKSYPVLHSFCSSL